MWRDRQDVLVDVVGAVRAHVHCCAAAFDAGPEGYVACGEVVGVVVEVCEVQRWFDLDVAFGIEE